MCLNFLIFRRDARFMTDICKRSTFSNDWVWVINNNYLNSLGLQVSIFSYSLFLNTEIDRRVEQPNVDKTLPVLDLFENYIMGASSVFQKQV